MAFCPAMKGLPSEILEAIRATFTSLSHLVIENIALRQQLAVLKVARPQPKLTSFDRAFWVFLSRIWPHWSDALILVMPDTVVRWHRAGIQDVLAVEVAQGEARAATHRS